jgi:RNA polymerase sigma factor (sigma-70 family)
MIRSPMTVLPPRGEDRTDVELLLAWQRGERDAAEKLTRRHYASVRRFFEVKASVAADDLTQKTFLGCLEAIDRIRSHTSFRAFLFGVARNQYLRFQRDAVRRRSAMSFEDDEVGRHTGMSTLVVRGEEQRLVLQAIAALPDELGHLVQLYYWEKLRTADIGSALQIPKSTVTTRLARARELMREHIERVSTPTPARQRLLADVDGWARSLARS